MRTLLIAALTCSLLPSVTPDAADACGFEPPQVFLLSPHSVPGGDGQPWHSRTFAILGEAVPSSVVWQQLAPRSYDNTMIADAPDLDRAMRLTLVGPAGTRVVASASRSFLQPAWGPTTPSAAIEIETGFREQFTIAVVGAHKKASWVTVDRVTTSDADRTWALAQGVAPDRTRIAVTRVHGSDVEAVSTNVPGEADTVTLVRRGGHQLARVDGRAIGALSLDRRNYLLIDHDGAVSAVMI